MIIHFNSHGSTPPSGSAGLDADATTNLCKSVKSVSYTFPDPPKQIQQNIIAPKVQTKNTVSHKNQHQRPQAQKKTKMHRPGFEPG